MPTLSTSNRSQAAYKVEGLYPTNFGVKMTAGNGINVAMTGESMNFDFKTEMSKNIRSDRGITSHVQVGASAAGDLSVEHIYREYDWAYESILGNTYTVYGTDGVSAVVASITATANTLVAGVAPTGNDAFSGLNKGQWFTIIPDVGATQAVKDYLKGRAFQASLTVAPGTPSTTITLQGNQIDTAIISAALTNAKIASSRLYTGTSMWSYNIEIAHQDISRFRQYLGMVPGKMNWKLASGAIVNGSISFMGKTMVSPLPTSTVMGTAGAQQPFVSANATRGVFDIIEGGSSISATTFIKSADITIDGSLRMQDAVGVFGTAGIAGGTFKIGGTLEVYFADSTLYNKFLAGVSTSLAIPVLDVDGNGYVYYFPKFIYSTGKTNAQGQDQDNMLSLTFECDIDSDPTSPTYQKVMAIYRVGAVRV
jgi:Phage tail tube protein